MNVTKDNAMLVDIQYVRKQKGNDNPDYLYVIYKNLDTGKKYLEVIPEPMMTIYFEKPEKRNHTYNKTYIKQEDAIPVTVPYTHIKQTIINDMGEIGKDFMNNIRQTGDWRRMDDVFLHPYVFGADLDVRSWYRYQWLQSLGNDRLKPVTVGMADIEVDTMEAGDAMTNPVYCPIDLITFIDSSTKTSYTFSLIGVECNEKDTTDMTEQEKQEEYRRRELYKNRIQTQNEKANEYYLRDAAHKLFDENYPDMEYRFYFYKDEAKMLTHIFELINKLRLDFVYFYNIAFDIPYIMKRMEVLGLDPATVMCDKDFPVKQCYFKEDTKNFKIKKKSDRFVCSSYSVYLDQMVMYAAIRSGEKEMRSYSLDYVASKEISDSKLNYQDDGISIRELSYVDYEKYVLYNIKDVLLQMKLEETTHDGDTAYVASYNNATPYESIFKKTVLIRNVHYMELMNNDLVQCCNFNAIKYNNQQKVEEDSDDEKVKFEGALVGNPNLINHFGRELYGKQTNSIFDYSIDFDMSAFYPSTKQAMNIEASTLICKMIMDSSIYDVRGGDYKFNGITDVQLVKDNKDSFSGDVSKEVMDNFQTGNIRTMGNKWMNLPTVNQIYKKLNKNK